MHGGESALPQMLQQRDHDAVTGARIAANLDGELLGKGVTDQSGQLGVERRGVG